MIAADKPHYAFIECVRGYAVLLVILCHATYLMPELPYPVHRITVMGWHGVQLFFLASAVTLMMSWRYEQARDGATDTLAFFIRRFFRIAPAYYAASLLYAWLAPPAMGFNLPHAAATWLFVNAWSPAYMPTTTTDWSVVPGSWSISVEFTFYALFPLLAASITSLRRAVVLAVAALVLGAVANTVMQPGLFAAFGDMPTDNFLYFWFPNQMCVFALGLALYHLLQRYRGAAKIAALGPNSLVAVATVLFLIPVYLPMPHWLSLASPVPPAFLVVSLSMMVLILGMARSRSPLLINRPIAFMGRISFSAYLLHFAVIEAVRGAPALQPLLHLTGMRAITVFPAMILCIVLIVAAMSYCSYRAIELPMIAVGKTLIARRRTALLGPAE